jgi:hypothetical protein
MNKSFEGVVAYPKKIAYRNAMTIVPSTVPITMVVVWIRRDITPNQRARLKQLRDKHPKCQIAVRSSPKGTTIQCIGQIGDANAVAKKAVVLGQNVTKITGARCVLDQLPTYADVGRLL